MKIRYPEHESGCQADTFEIFDSMELVFLVEAAESWPLSETMLDLPNLFRVI